LIKEVKTHLGRVFNNSDLGLLHYCIGIEVWKKDNLDGLKLIVGEDSKHVDWTLYRQLVGNVIYSITTITDLSYPLSIVSWLNTYPKLEH